MTRPYLSLTDKGLLTNEPAGKQTPIVREVVKAEGVRAGIYHTAHMFDYQGIFLGNTDHGAVSPDEDCFESDVVIQQFHNVVIAMMEYRGKVQSFPYQIRESIEDIIGQLEPFIGGPEDNPHVLSLERWEKIILQDSVPKTRGILSLFRQKRISS